MVGQCAVTLPRPELDWNPGLVIKSLPPPSGASLVAQTVKNLSAMWETQVPSLGQEDPLEKGMATHSSILAWRIPWTEGWAEVKRLTVTVFLMHVGNF